MKRFTHIRFFVVLVLLVSLASSQAMSMGYPHQLFSGKRVWKKHTSAIRTSKKAPQKSEGTSQATWAVSVVEADDDSEASMAYSLVRFVSGWLTDLLRPRTTCVAVRVGIPVELLKQTRPLSTKATPGKMPLRLSTASPFLLS